MVFKKNTSLHVLACQSTPQILLAIFCQATGGTSRLPGAKTSRAQCGRGLNWSGEPDPHAAPHTAFER